MLGFGDVASVSGGWVLYGDITDDMVAEVPSKKVAIRAAQMSGSR
jgi:hypothetical protein